MSTVTDKTPEEIAKELSSETALALRLALDYMKSSHSDVSPMDRGSREASRSLGLVIRIDHTSCVRFTDLGCTVAEVLMRKVGT